MGYSLKFNVLTGDYDVEQIPGSGSSSGADPVYGSINQATELEPELGEVKMYALSGGIGGLQLRIKGKGQYAGAVDNLGQLGFVAREIGLAGNEISIEYVNPGPDNEELGISVEDKKITITLITGPADPVAASKTTSLGIPNADLTFTANESGSAGNVLNIAYSDPGDDQGSTTATKLGDEQVLVVMEKSGGDIVATANDVIAAIEGDPDCNALISVELAPGSDGTGIMPEANISFTLEGGLDGGVISDANDTRDALQNNEDVMELLSDVAIDNSGVMEEQSEFFLQNGDEDFFSAQLLID